MERRRRSHRHRHRAHGERVAHRVNGLKVHVHEPASVVNLLRELIADRRELERLRKGIHRGLYRTTSDHVQLLTARYEKLLAAHRVRARGEEFFEESPARRSASAGNIFRMHATWLAWEGRSGPAVPSDASKAVWKKVLPYLRSHGVRATALRSAEKLIEPDRSVVLTLV